jgi:putative tryptophan/tyrosine transport system substrate-binding protein
VPTRRIGLAVVLAVGLILVSRAAAQEATKVYRIGILANYPVSPSITFINAMRGLGYVEGQNFVLVIRSAEQKPERLPALAAELVNLKVDIIITGGDSEVRAAKQATETIPIIMAPSGDPVSAGYVASFAKPGGNVTGLSWMSPELSGKLLEVLKDTVPRVTRVAVLWNAANPVKRLDFDQTRRAVELLGLKISSVEVTSLAGFETAFTKIVRGAPRCTSFASG